MQFVGVIDGNNFFVSCERLFRPDLARVPVVVLSSNDGCIVARSSEIKDMGVPMGVPYFQVKDILKKVNARAFSSHFALYRDISARVFSEVRAQFQVMEQYSIDEAFFMFEATSVAEAVTAMRDIKQLLEKRVGIPVSIGLAATKTQAKYANRLAKKAGGVVVLAPEDWEAKTATTPLSDIWGVGGRLSARYRSTGMTTVADVLGCPKQRLSTLFGVSGVRLQAELSGQVQFPVNMQTSTQKSIMSSRSFKKTTDSLAVLKDAVSYHVRHAAADLRRYGLIARTLSVSIGTSRHGDYLLRGGTLTVELGSATADTLVLLGEALRLAEQLYEPGVPYKKAGIMLGQFAPETTVQPSLFLDQGTEATTGTLMKTIDTLNLKFGQDMVRVGQHTKAAAWSPSRADLSPAYTTNWTMLPTVQT